MPTTRTFNFPISILISSAKRFLSALRDPIVGPPVLARLKRKAETAPFDAAFATQIDAVELGGSAQSKAKGEIGELTQEQAEAFTEMERLTSSARRTAALAFPKNDVRLRAEFQQGINEPQDFDSVLERARLVLAACQTHADALDEHGWIEADTTLLQQTIATLSGDDLVKESSKDAKLSITATRTRAANALYKSCQTIQNAARLAYPSTQLGKTEGLEAARARYLINEFPPRSGNGNGGNDEPPAPTPVPVPLK